MLSIALFLGTIMGINPLWRNTWYAFLPSMVLSLVSLPLTYRKVTQLRREQRRANGSCVKCGYDLRATPDRCPECGTPSAKPEQCGLAL